jgi:hypothetical protein
LVQAQGIDGEVAAGLSGGKGGDRLRGGLQYGLVVDRAPGREAHPTNANSLEDLVRITAKRSVYSEDQLAEFHATDACPVRVIPLRRPGVFPE